MKILEHDDFEIILRRIMCIFFCIEAIALSSSIAGKVDDVLYFTHRYGFGYMIFTHIFGIILPPLLYAIIPMFAKPIYRIIEMVHMFAGTVLLILGIALGGTGLTGSDELIYDILWFLLIAGRGWLYFILITVCERRQKFAKVQDQNISGL